MRDQRGGTEARLERAERHHDHRGRAEAWLAKSSSKAVQHDVREEVQEEVVEKVAEGAEEEVTEKVPSTITGKSVSAF